MNLQDHIRRYLALMSQADELFRAVAEKHGPMMPCKPGCDDCCNVYFELSLIEAFTINGMFWEKCPEGTRNRVLARAEDVQPLFERARDLLHGIVAAEGPASGKQVAEEASRLKIPCPLSEGHSCVLYEHRPVTCRLYGTPQKIGGEVVTCPNSGFGSGGRYATIDVDRIQSMLYDYSRELLLDLLAAAPSAPPGPLFSMPEALCTKFDKQFFLSLGKSLEAEKDA